MSVPVKLAVRAAPVYLGGQYIARRMGANASPGVLSSDSFNLGALIDPARVDILGDAFAGSRIRMLNGDITRYETGRPRRNLKIDCSAMPIADARILAALLRSGRPISIGAWYDSSTVWMSHFGGKGGDEAAFAGPAEVGSPGGSNISRRDASNDWSPDPFAGYSILRKWPTDAYSNKLLKLAPGMIGAAAVFDSARGNKALRRMSSTGTTLWQASGGAIMGKSAEILQPFSGLSVPGEVAVINKGTDYADYITAGTTTGLTIGAAYTVSTYVRGNGEINLGWLESSSVKQQATFVLTDEWQRISITYEASATSAEIRIYPKPGGTSVTVQPAGCQIEAGYGASSFLNTAAVPTEADRLLLGSPINFAAGITFVWWLKWNHNDDQKYLFSMNRGSGGEAFAVYAEGSAVLFTFDDSGYPLSISIDNGLDGLWTQIVLTMEAGNVSPNAGKVRWYVNGAAVGSAQNADLPTFYPSATGQLAYLGSDHGLASPGERGAQMPIDAFRIDERVWTAADVLADYQQRTDPGIAGLLEMVQGRYFGPSARFSPHGPYLDLLDFTVDLEEEIQRCGSVP